MINKRFCIGLLAIAVAGGCNQASAPLETSNEPGAASSIDLPSPATVHAHPSEGPHHGTLIELGNEEFHAELVHDEKSVTVYVLDSSAKTSVPIDTSEIVINLMHDGKPEQFKLAAAPEEQDPKGKSSRFVANDRELASHVDDEAAAPKLSIVINGKSYRGTIAHEHSHDHPH